MSLLYVFVTLYLYIYSIYSPCNHECTVSFAFLHLFCPNFLLDLNLSLALIWRSLSFSKPYSVKNSERHKTSNQERDAFHVLLKCPISKNMLYFKWKRMYINQRQGFCILHLVFNISGDRSTFFFFLPRTTDMEATNVQVSHSSST